MSYFIRGSADDLTPVQHANSIFMDYMGQNTLTGLMGKKGSGKPIIVDNTIKGSPGDTIRYHFIPHLDASADDSDAIVGQNPSILGNEESLDEYYCDLSIDETNKALRFKGKMSDKRVIWDKRKVGKKILTEWWRKKNEVLIIGALDGRMSNATWGITTSAGTETTDQVNGTGRCIRADGAADSAAVTAANSDNTALASAVDSGDKMNVQLIENAVIMAKTGGTYKIEPVRVGPNGEEYFFLLLCLQAARDLRKTPEWQDRALQVADRGLENDPMATGALGIWNNVIVKESERIHRFSDSTDYIARNLFLGANACVVGWAQTTDYTEERIDHNRELSIKAGEIRGQNKLQFNSVDTGVIQVITAANS